MQGWCASVSLICNGGVQSATSNAGNVLLFLLQPSEWWCQAYLR